MYAVGSSERKAAVNSKQAARHCHGSSAFSHHRFPCRLEWQRARMYIKRMISRIVNVLHIIHCKLFSLFEFHFIQTINVGKVNLEPS